MIIANPIYDVVFKRLMENERVAKFFIGTLLNEDVVSLKLKPQEFTYFDKDRVPIAIFRLDFMATIKTAKGEDKKVLIEIQKARNETDLMRFRSYLAEQYTKEDTVDGVTVVLPITTIYILGFKLHNIKSACVKVRRRYHDLINNKIIDEKNEFIEKLTHDSFVVQVKRITGKYKSKLDKLLSVFEQNNFVDDRGVVKNFNHETDIEEVKIMTDILHHTGTNPAERKQIEDEQEAWRTIDEYTEGKLKSIKAEVKVKDKIIKETKKELKETKTDLKETKTDLKETKADLKETKADLKETKDVLKKIQDALKQKDQTMEKMMKEFEAMKKNQSNNK